jgi:ribonucleoside-diphosphate reductase alpha chain
MHRAASSAETPPRPSEPYRANAYTQKTKTGSFLVANPYLKKRLQELGQDTDEVWSSIIVNGGSVQHLDFLSDIDKDVFKTAIEIDQRWVIDHAADRQEFVCQAQSVNVFLPANVHVTLLHHIHFRAWKKGLKSLYYLRSEAIKRAETVSNKIERSALNDYETCLSCEG